MFTDLLEIILSYMQFLVLVINTDPTLWPTAWRSTSIIASVVNLDSEFFKEYAAIIPQDFRVYFVFVGVLIPLGLILFGLLALNSKKVVLWYGVLLGGLTALVVGILAVLLKTAGGITIAQDVANLLMIAGGCAVFCCIIAVVIAKTCAADADEVSSVKELKEEQTAKIQPWILLQQALLFFVLVALGVILVAFNISGFNVVFGSLGFAIAIVCFIFAGFTLLFFLMGLCVSGRRALWAIQLFASQNFMRLLLITISVLYIPIGASTMTIFNCNPFQCPSGERLVDSESLVPLGLNATSELYCNLCAVPAQGQLCPADFRDSICMPLVANRLESDKSLECSEMRAFFWPSAGIVAAVYILGSVSMFFALVRQSTRILRDDFPIKNPSDNEQENWEQKVEGTDNVAKFLYQSYKFTFRYGRIFQLVHKLLIVFTTAYVVRLGSTSPVIIALGAALAVHTTFMLLLFIARPFLRLIEGVTAGALTTLVVGLVAVGIVLFFGINVNEDALTGVLIFCCVAPVLFLIVGLVIEYIAAKNANDAKATEKQGKMDLAVEVIATNREHDRVAKKIAELRENLAGELSTQKKLEKNTTAAAKDTLRRSKERTDQLRDELRQHEGFLEELKEYRADLESGAIDVEASIRSHPEEQTELAVAAMETSIVITPQVQAAPALRPGTQQSGRPGTQQGAGGTGGRKSVNLEASASSNSASPIMSPRPGTQQGGGRAGLQNGRLGVGSTGRPPVSPGGQMGRSSGTFDGSASGRNMMSPRMSDSMNGRSPRMSDSGRNAQRPAPLGTLVNNAEFNDTTSSTALGGVGSRHLNLSGSGMNSRPSLGMSGEGSPRFLPKKNSNSTTGTSSPRGTFDASASSPGARKKGGQENQPSIPLSPLREDRSHSQSGGIMGEEFGTVAEDSTSMENSMIAPVLEQDAAQNPMLIGGLGGGEWADSISGDDEKSSSEEEDFDVSDSDDDEDVKKKPVKVEMKAESMSSKRTDSPTGGLRKTKSVFSEAANAVAALLAAEEEDEEDAQQTVDHNINTAMQNTLNRFLMVGGIAGFVALGFALLGLLTASDDGVVIAHASSTSVQNHFAGYGNWSVMVSECCCLPYYIDGPGTIAAVEKWVCQSGVVMERKRATRTIDGDGNQVALVDGFSIRSMCSTNFTSSDCLAYSDGAGDVVLSCTDITITAAERALW